MPNDDRSKEDELPDENEDRQAGEEAAERMSQDDSGGASRLSGSQAQEANKAILAGIDKITKDLTGEAADEFRDLKAEIEGYLNGPKFSESRENYRMLADMIARRATRLYGEGRDLALAHAFSDTAGHMTKVANQLPDAAGKAQATPLADQIKAFGGPGSGESARLVAEYESKPGFKPSNTAYQLLANLLHAEYGARNHWNADIDPGSHEEQVIDGIRKAASQAAEFVKSEYPEGDGEGENQQYFVSADQPDGEEEKSKPAERPVENTKPQRWLAIGDREESLGPNREATFGIGEGSDVNFPKPQGKDVPTGSYVKVRTDAEGNVELKLVNADPKARAAIETKSGITPLTYSENANEGWVKFDPKTDKLAFGGLKMFELKPQQKQVANVTLFDGTTDTQLEPGDEISIGREVEGQGKVEGAKVSRNHGKLFYTEKGIFVTDSGSTNGTWVQRPGEANPILVPVSQPGKPAKQFELKPGDRVWFGPAGNKDSAYADVEPTELKSVGVPHASERPAPRSPAVADAPPAPPAAAAEKAPSVEAPRRPLEPPAESTRPQRWLRVGESERYIAPNREVTFGIGSGADINFIKPTGTDAPEGAYVKVRTDAEGKVEIKLIKNDPKARAAIETRSGITPLTFSENPNEGWVTFDPKRDKLAFGGVKFFELKPEQKQTASVSLFNGDGTNQRNLESGEEVSIGREVEGPGRLENAKASRLHGKIVYNKKGIFVADLGSTNGTWVERPGEAEPIRVPVTPEGKPAKLFELKPGDRVWFGTPKDSESSYADLKPAELRSEGVARKDAAARELPRVGDSVVIERPEANSKPQKWLRIENRDTSANLGPNREATLGIGKGSDGKGSDINFTKPSGQDVPSGQILKVRTDADGNVEVKLISSDPKAGAAIETASGIQRLTFSENANEGWVKFNPKTDKLAFGGLQFFKLRQEEKPAVEISLVDSTGTRPIELKEEIPIGRDVNGTGQVSGRRTSGNHGKLTYTADGVFVSDNGSTNGTFIERPGIARPIRVNQADGEVEVKPGDKIWFGTVGNRESSYAEIKPIAAAYENAGRPRTDAVERLARPKPVSPEVELGIKKGELLATGEGRVVDAIRDRDGRPLAVVENRYKISGSPATARVADAPIKPEDLDASGKKLNAEKYQPIDAPATEQGKLYYNRETGELVRVQEKDGMPVAKVPERDFALLKPKDIEAHREAASPTFERTDGLVPGPRQATFKVGDRVPLTAGSYEGRVLRMSGNQSEAIVSTGKEFNAKTARVRVMNMQGDMVDGKPNPERFDPIDLRVEGMGERDRLYRDRAHPGEVVMISQGPPPMKFTRPDLMILSTTAIQENMALALERKNAGRGEPARIDPLEEIRTVERFANESARVVQELQRQLQRGDIDLKEASKRFTEMVRAQMRAAGVDSDRIKATEFEFRADVKAGEAPYAQTEWGYKRHGVGETLPARYDAEKGAFVNAETGRKLDKHDVPIKRVILPVEQLRTNPAQMVHNAYVELVASSQRSFEAAADPAAGMIGTQRHLQDRVSASLARALEAQPEFRGQMVADRPGYLDRLVGERANERTGVPLQGGEQVKPNRALGALAGERMTRPQLEAGPDGPRLQQSGAIVPPGEEFSAEERRELAEKHRKAAREAKSAEERDFHGRIADGLESKNPAERRATEGLLREWCGGKARTMAIGVGVLALVSAGIGLAMLLKRQKEAEKLKEAEIRGNR